MTIGMPRRTSVMGMQRGARSEERGAGVGICRTPVRDPRSLLLPRRFRNPFPDRRPRSIGRPGGFRSAGWSCCKSLREMRRPCRPSTSRQSCLVVGTAPWSAIWARIRCITLRGSRADFDHGVARIVPRLADRDVGDAKLAAAGRDRIEHLGQDEAVDDVAGDLDFFDEWERRSGVRRWIVLIRHRVTEHRGGSELAKVMRRIMPSVLDLRLGAAAVSSRLSARREKPYTVGGFRRIGKASGAIARRRPIKYIRAIEIWKSRNSSQNGTTWPASSARRFRPNRAARSRPLSDCERSTANRCAPAAADKPRHAAAEEAGGRLGQLGGRTGSAAGSTTNRRPPKPPRKPAADRALREPRQSREAPRQERPRERPSDRNRRTSRSRVSESRRA